MSGPWWKEKEYPKPATSESLIDKVLVLDPDRPPEDTKFPGMKSVYVKEVVGKVAPFRWKVFKVLMTEQDLFTAIGAMQQKKVFTYGKTENAEYATVSIKSPVA